MILTYSQNSSQNLSQKNPTITPLPGEIADMVANALEISKLQLFHGPVTRRPALPGQPPSR